MAAEREIADKQEQEKKEKAEQEKRAIEEQRGQVSTEQAGHRRFQSERKKQHDEDWRRLEAQFKTGVAFFKEGRVTYRKITDEMIDVNDEARELRLRNPAPEVTHIQNTTISDILKKLKEAKVLEQELVNTRQARDNGRAMGSAGDAPVTHDVTLPLTDNLQNCLESRLDEMEQQLKKLFDRGATSPVPLPASKILGVNQYPYDIASKTMSLKPATQPERQVAGMPASLLVRTGVFQVCTEDVAYLEVLSKMQLHQRSVSAVLISMIKKLRQQTPRREDLIDDVIEAMEELEGDATVTTVEAFAHTLMLRRSSLLQSVEAGINTGVSIDQMTRIMTGAGLLSKTLVAERPVRV